MDRFAAGLKTLNIVVPEAVQVREIEFLDELLRWNARVNLTSIRKKDEAVEKHLLDSLAVLPFISEKCTLLDMGSGGGFPGIPLAIARPEVKVTSVDSVGKKINFQKHIKRKMQLTNLKPLQSRLENLADLLTEEQRFDYVIARAFSSIENIIAFAAPWLAEEGTLLVMKGPDGKAELAETKNFTGSGFRLAECCEYVLPQSRSSRQLLVLKRSTVPIY